jgi:diadenosine tetraphosphate (Ap4A) HIT family hydrolase
MKFLDMRHARTDAQRAQMGELVRMDICPFCEEYLVQHHREPIECQSRWWSVTKNDYPYAGASICYLLIFRQHTERIEDMPIAAFAELGDHVQGLTRRFNIPGATLLFRHGDTGYTGATIKHLHAHLIAGADYSETAEKLRASIGYKV